MAQSDYNIGANPSGLNMRTEINTIFDSILTNNSGTTAPTVTSAFMRWVDTSNVSTYYLKQRNHDNTAWNILFTYDVATKTLTAYTNDTVHLTGNETISGTKTFYTSPIIPTPTTTGNVITMDNIIQKTAVGIGYGNGAGGAVTQLTSKSTAVTLNKPTGYITMNNATLAAGASVSFTVNNSIVSGVDIISITPFFGGVNPNNYRIEPLWSAAGSFSIRVTNISAGSLSESLEFKFIVIKGASA